MLIYLTEHYCKMTILIHGFLNFWVSILMGKSQGPLKGIIHPKTHPHPQAIICGYDLLLSPEHNQSYIKEYPGFS